MGAVLREGDVRTRQLSDQQRSMLSASHTTVVFILVLLVVPCASGEGLLSMSAFKAGDPRGAIEPLGGAACVLLAAGLVLWLLRRNRLRLLLAFAADAPAVPGQPATCHVCGAPLEAGVHVVRCGYCAADNIVDEHAIRRAAASRRVVFAEQAAAVIGGALRHDLLSRIAGWTLLFLVPVAAFGGHAATRGAVALLDAQVEERPPKADIRYVALRSGRTCNAIARTDGKGNVLVRRGGTLKWLPARGAAAGSFEAEKLVGAFAGGEYRSHSYTGDVIRVYSEPGVSDNRALVRIRGHARLGDVDARIDVSDLCVVVRPGALPVADEPPP
jgi:hypothetical protein